MELRLSQDMIDSFVKRSGEKRANRILTIMGKNQQFVNAISTPLGQEILRDVLVMMEERLDKIASLTATPQETSEYKILKELTEKWRDRINNYITGIQEIQKNGG